VENPGSNDPIGVSIVKKSRFTERQIVGILKESEAGAETPELCRKHGSSSATFYAWKSKFGGMGGQRRGQDAVARRRKPPTKTTPGGLCARDRCAETNRFGKLLTPAQRRRAAQAVIENVGLSQRRACKVATCHPKTFRRILLRPADDDLKTRLQALATERRRFSYRRLHVLLRRDGIMANHKRVYRVYAAAHLQIRKRLKRRVAFGRGEPAPLVTTYNERWSLDFVHDTLRNGRRIRTLNIVDDFTRECLAIEVDTSISGSRVARVLDRIADTR
jgi:putative transposase